MNCQFISKLKKATTKAHLLKGQQLVSYNCDKDSVPLKIISILMSLLFGNSQIQSLRNWQEWGKKRSAPEDM